MIDLNDTLLQSILIDYLFECKNSIKNIGVPIVKPIRFGDTLTYYITYIIYQKEVNASPPTYYTIVNDKPILLYTGFEHYTDFKPSDFKEPYKRLYKRDMNITYSPAIWKVTIIKGKLVSKEYVDKLPY